MGASPALAAAAPRSLGRGRWPGRRSRAGSRSASCRPERPPGGGGVLPGREGRGPASGDGPARPHLRSEGPLPGPAPPSPPAGAGKADRVRGRVGPAQRRAQPALQHRPPDAGGPAGRARDRPADRGRRANLPGVDRAGKGSRGRPRGVGGYLVYRRIASRRKSTKRRSIRNRSSGTTFVDSNPPYGAVHFYTVRAVLADRPRSKGRRPPRSESTIATSSRPRRRRAWTALPEASLVRLVWDPVSSARPGRLPSLPLGGGGARGATDRASDRRDLLHGLDDRCREVVSVYRAGRGCRRQREPAVARGARGALRRLTLMSCRRAS